MSSPLPTAARTQGASKRVVAQRDAGVADAQWLELLWALRQVHAAGWVDQMRLTMPTLAQSNFGRKWAVQWLGRGAICPRAKWENFEPWDSKKFHRGVRKLFFAVFCYTLVYWLEQGPIHAAKPFIQTTDYSPCIFPWQCFAAGPCSTSTPTQSRHSLGKMIPSATNYPTITIKHRWNTWATWRRRTSQPFANN